MRSLIVLTIFTANKVLYTSYSSAFKVFSQTVHKCDYMVSVKAGDIVASSSAITTEIW